MTAPDAAPSSTRRGFAFRRLRLAGFGPFENYEVSFSPGLNVLLGENATGKTQLIGGALFALLGTDALGVSVQPEASTPCEAFAELEVSGIECQLVAKAVPTPNSGPVIISREILPPGTLADQHLRGALLTGRTELLVTRETLPSDTSTPSDVRELLAFEGYDVEALDACTHPMDLERLGKGARILIGIACAVLDAERAVLRIPKFYDLQLYALDPPASAVARKLLSRLACHTQVVCVEVPHSLAWAPDQVVGRLPPWPDHKRGLSAVSFDPTRFRAQAQRTSRKARYFSAFISYGMPDEREAVALKRLLDSEGVQTFLFCEDALPGQKLHRMMSDGVANYDRVILLCSRGSLERSGVLNEIEQVLAREAREGGSDRLIPITLDDYVFADWKPARRDLARALKDRVIADFRRAFQSEDRRQRAMHQLLASLQRKPTRE